MLPGNSDWDQNCLKVLTNDLKELDSHVILFNRSPAICTADPKCPYLCWKLLRTSICLPWFYIIKAAKPTVEGSSLIGWQGTSETLFEFPSYLWKLERLYIYRRDGLFLMQWNEANLRLTPVTLLQGSMELSPHPLEGIVYHRIRLDITNIDYSIHTASLVTLMKSLE